MALYARKRSQQRGRARNVVHRPDTVSYVVIEDLAKFRQVFAACLRAHEAESVESDLTTQETAEVGPSTVSTTESPSTETNDGCKPKSDI